MKLTTLGVGATFLLFALLGVPVWADARNSGSAVPGTLNYVEGQVSLGSRTLNSKSIGSAEMEAGQSLRTRAGKAEVLLTPGVFLRVGSHSSVRMISSGLTDTHVEVDRGHAMLEVAEIHPENDLRVTADGTTTTLLKTGLYDFNLRDRQVRVFDGKAVVRDDTEHVKLKGGRELNLANVDEPLKSQKFDKKAYEGGDLYRWSSLRSAYVAEANVNAASAYMAYGWGPWGPGWWGAGWYWDPWFDAFTFVPGDGIFYSPFGWGFYSPWWVYESPIYVTPMMTGSPSVVHHFSANAQSWGPGMHYVAQRSYANGIYHGPGSGGAFHSGPRTMDVRTFGGMSAGRVRGGFGGGGFHDGGFHEGGVSIHRGGRAGFPHH